MHSVFLHWLPFVVFGVHLEIIWEGGGQIAWELRYVPYKSFRGRGQIISDLEIISGYESIIIIIRGIIICPQILLNDNCRPLGPVRVEIPVRINNKTMINKFSCKGV